MAVFRAVGVSVMTFHELIVRIRSIAEHSMTTDNDDPMRNTRTTHANWSSARSSRRTS